MSAHPARPFGLDEVATDDWPALHACALLLSVTAAERDAARERRRHLLDMLNTLPRPYLPKPPRKRKPRLWRIGVAEEAAWRMAAEAAQAGAARERAFTDQAGTGMWA